MRNIVMFNRVTADGYFTSTEGKLDWVVPDAEVDRAGAEGMPHIDTILFGRKTYEMFASFWPHVTEQSSDPHRPGGSSPEMLTFAKMLNETPKIVFSRTLKEAAWKNSRIVRALDPGEIKKMKQQSGKGMIVFGSGEIVSLLTRHRLIDEYHFVVAPLFLGDGRSLIAGLSQRTPLVLLEAKAHPSGNLSLRYAPAG